jgi:periplasmic protein TonB
MDTNKILTSDYLDIVFDGRNKAYGGYELRRNYGQRVAKSMMVLVFLALSISALAVRNLKPGKKAIEYVTPVAPIDPHIFDPPITPPPPPVPPPPPPPPAPPHPTTRFTQMVIDKDDRINEHELPPNQKDIVESGPTDADGELTDLKPAIGTPGGTGEVVTPIVPKVFNYVEQMPKPDYDVQTYLAKNMKYPDAARENNIEGRVIVEFVINEDGSISNIQVAQGIGGGCDQEAMRVIGTLPPWKAGKQNGKAVKVLFKLPIVFKLQ